MTPDCVLVASDRVPPRVVEAVTPACARLGVRVAEWHGDGALPALPTEPLLLLSMLYEGERQIPRNIAEVASHQLPGVPLLLLTEERLIQPWLALQNGRVSLLGAPLTDLRLTSMLQSLVVARRGERLRTDRFAGTPATRVEKTVLGRAWVATVAQGALDDSCPTTAVSAGVGRGVVVVIGPQAPQHLAEATARWGQGAAPVLPEPASVVVALNASGDELYVESGRDDVTLWLASPDRAPRVFDVSRAIATGGSGFTRLVAAPRDLLLVVWARGAHHISPTDINDAMLDGGPQLVAAIEQSLQGHPDQLLAAIVEVR